MLSLLLAFPLGLFPADDQTTLDSLTVPIPNSNLATMAANTVKANATGGAATPTDFAVGTNNVLGRVGGNIVAAQLVGAQVTTNTLANSKLAQPAANTVRTNNTAGVANIVDLAVGTNTVLGRAAGNIVAAQLVAGQVANNTLTTAKLAQPAANTVRVNNTAGATDIVDLNMPLSTVLARLGSGNIVAANVGDTNTLLGTVTITGAQTITGAKTFSALGVFNGKIGVNTASPASASAVQIDSTTQGFAPPRMSGTQRNAIVSPFAGLMVYNSTTGLLSWRDATGWREVVTVDTTQTIPGSKTIGGADALNVTHLTVASAPLQTAKSFRFTDENMNTSLAMGSTRGKTEWELLAAPTQFGTAQSGAASTITLAAGEPSQDDYYNNYTVEITSGTGIGQVRSVSDYDGGTKIATVSAAWTTTPDVTSQYALNLVRNMQFRFRNERPGDFIGGRLPADQRSWSALDALRRQRLPH